MRYFFTTFICWIFLSISCSSGFPEPNTVENEGDKEGAIDILKVIYEIAEEKGMYVISDLNMNGGDLFQKYTAEYVENQHNIYIQRYYGRYGGYKSFWGWYLNNELNPLKSDEVPISTFWRKIWKNAVQECKRVDPQSVVTISPFFLLDKNSYRGFEYLEPIEYEKWWSKTLSETGIDILMLQDSGAEHLGFFTMEERRPFFQAFKNACNQAECKLWLNVESGEIDAKDWAEAIEMERTNTQKWVYTRTEWLAQKLALAAEYGEDIVNWGYYPFMHPGPSVGPYPSNDFTVTEREANYTSYKVYYNQQIQKPVPPVGTPRPIIRGTLWWLPAEVPGMSLEEFANAVRFQIEKQKEVGFDLLWIVNAPANMQKAMEYD